MEMLERDVLKPWRDKVQEFTSLKSIQFVLYKHAWKVMKLWELRKSSRILIFSLQLQEIKISLQPNICLKWNTMLLLEILDILIMKSISRDLRLGKELREFRLNLNVINGSSLMDMVLSCWLKVDSSIWDVPLVIHHLWCQIHSQIKLWLKLNYGLIEIMENIAIKVF